ncbi:MAG: D-alanyl-D-alanine carboxypeptidase/D-alanyl-D-alanine-endopeptidase [Aeromicrobium sp.]
MAAQRGTRVVAGAAALAVPLVVVALVVSLGMTAWGRGDLNRFICDGDCGPSNVVAPRGLAAAPPPAVAVPSAPEVGPIDPAKLAAAVSPALDDPVLGPRVGFAAASPDGTELFAAGARPYAPASTTKVLVAFAALSEIDPGTRFATRVVRSGDGIALVGGGDPYLATKRAGRNDDRVVRADLTTLARRTATALEAAGTTAVTLGYDASLFLGPATSPAWEPSYLTGNIVTPVSALWVDQGVTDGVRDRDPAADAARTFADLLADRGITVDGSPAAVVAGADAQPVAEVLSAPVEQIVETLVRVSDNQAAEVVLRHVAIAAGRPADFEGGTGAVAAAVQAAGVDATGLVLNDGSGLSRDNRITPRLLVQTLGAAARSSRTAGLIADLPVGGFTGTLVGRFADLTAARGAVRAKTGTLTGIHSLAGYATDADGRPVLFAVMADRADEDQPFAAQAALDEVAAAIAGCSCG